MKKNKCQFCDREITTESFDNICHKCLEIALRIGYTDQTILNKILNPLGWYKKDVDK